MKVTAAAMTALYVSALCSQGCHASPGLRANSEDEDRKLQSSYHVTMSSPLNWDGYFSDILDPTSSSDDNVFCYNQMLRTVNDGPTTAQFLVMFKEKFVEHKGKVYASLKGGYGSSDAHMTEGSGGLYEVTDQSESCVKFDLLYADNHIGQIVASSQFDPIEIIGVSGTTIYGYYPESGGWARKATLWGDAKDGSLAAEPVEGGLVTGFSTNNRMFGLWGDSVNFNYHKHDDIECSSRPANIGDWTGFWAGSRGSYCPGAGNNQLRKFTWHSDGDHEVAELIWKPAAKIARLGPTSNIFGIDTSGRLLSLWDEKKVAVHAWSLSPSQFPELTRVIALGGLDDGYARGVFAVNDQDEVYNVYWEGGWKTKSMNLYLDSRDLPSIFFGSHKGKTYVLYGTMPLTSCRFSQYSIARFEFVGGDRRYDKVSISNEGRERQLKDRKLCL